MRGWALVVPVKSLDVAKSRLAGFAGQRRSALALAFAADTLAAARACPDVVGIAVVTDDEAVAVLARSLGCLAVPDEPSDGLNAALAHGAAVACAHWSDALVAALSADLPALRPAELAMALQAGRQALTAFVADADGRGTTLLTAATPEAFAPRFGPGSAAAHRRAGAVELTGLEVPSLRRDVDTAADLAAARGLGLGHRTLAVLRELAEGREQPPALA